MNYRCFLDDQPLSVLSAAVYPAPYNDVKRTEYVIAHGDGGQTMRIVSEKKVESAVIRPLSLGWTADVREDGLYIDLKKPANISVEINGGYDDALLVFYAPAREESVREGDPHVRYFAPGVHEAGVMDICEDNTTVYLAEGAYVHGKLNVHDCAGFTAEDLDFLAGKRLDLVTLDCTYGGNAPKSVGHMGYAEDLKCREQLKQRGAADDKTIFVANHFSHNGVRPYADMQALLPGFIISYDGMVIEF